MKAPVYRTPSKSITYFTPNPSAVKDALPGLIAGVLAEGFAGGESAASRRAEAAVAAQGVLEEVC